MITTNTLGNNVALDRRNGNVRGFGALVVASSFMPYVPENTMGTYIFAITAVFFVIFSILRYGLFISDYRSVSALIFIVWSVISYFTLESNGYGFSEWYRAVFPFLFFLLLLFLGRLDAPSRIILSKYLFAACLLWGVRIIGEALVLATQGSDVLSVRLTYNVTDAVLPFPFIALPYLLFCKDYMTPRFRWLLLSALTYMFVWIGYRAGIVLALIPVAFFLMDNFVKKNVWPAAAFFVLIAAVYFSGIFTSFGLMDRYDGLASEVDGAKAAEWAYAIDHFLSAPITGMGMGWQVPGDIAYIGVDTSEIVVPNTVGYVHSAFAYMAMNLGLLGIGLYYSIVTPRFFRIDDDSIHKFSSLALLLLMLFCLTQASFRTIQTVIMTVALLKINARSRC